MLPGLTVLHGGYAYPKDSPSGGPGQYGITKRDYFAAAALPAIIANFTMDVSVDRIAERAYAVADAMINRRDK